MRRLFKASSTLLLSCFATALTAISAQPALAAPPTQQNLSYAGDIVYACPRATLVESYRTDVHETFWYDANGNMLSANLHYRYDGTITNLTSGAVTLVHGDSIGKFDGTTFDMAISGNMELLRGAGGVITHTVGRLVMDQDGNILFQAGQVEGETVAICNLLT